MNSRPIDSLRLHPAHDKVPMASGDDLANLRKSLAENGQQDPIDITPDGVILDGRTRWTILREQGAQTVAVREWDIPDGQQVAWIVDRAISRRHLSMAEKRDLNDVLRSLVVEVREHPETGEEMRIGMNRAQRAATLGVGEQTVKTWDRRSGPFGPDRLAETGQSDAPTHIQRTGGNTSPLPLLSTKPTREPPTRRAEKRQAAAKARATYHPPIWLRHFTNWVRRPLPEDRDVLRRMDTEIHRAIELLEGEES